MRSLILISLLLALGIAACGPAPAAAPSSGGPSQTQVGGVTPTLGADGLTLELLKNMTYELVSSDTPRTITLVDGNFTSSDPASVDYLKVNLLDKVALSDLDGDGHADAAAALAEEYGGSGTFVSLVAFLDRDGQPEQGGAEFIDDRPTINSLTADDGVITLDVVVHGPNDPMCCPTQREIMTFTLTDHRLALQSVTSFTPTGAERSITTESPAEGAEVSGSVQLQGSFTISPFENTLTYDLLDASGVELLSGPISVTAAELGGPGTFETAVDISTIPPGTPIQISVQDTSPADGSILALDAVSVTVR